MGILSDHLPKWRRNAALADMLHPLHYRRVSDDVADQIRTIVASGGLRPGEQLPPERDLALMMHISRGAVRAGLRRLEQTGLVEMRRGRGGGTFIARQDTSGVAMALHDQYYVGGIPLADLTEARILLETLNVRLVVERAVLGHYELLGGDIILGERVWKAGAWWQRWDVRVGFHLRLAETTDNKMLVMLTEAMLRATFDFTHAAKADPPYQALRFRRRLLRQMRAGDADGAVATMTAYLTKQQGRYRDPMAEREQAEQAAYLREREEQAAEIMRNREADALERAMYGGAAGRWLPAEEEAAREPDERAAQTADAQGMKACAGPRSRRGRIRGPRAAAGRDAREGMPSGHTAAMASFRRQCADSNACRRDGLLCFDLAASSPRP